jgi:hypothetical protein
MASTAAGNKSSAVPASPNSWSDAEYRWEKEMTTPNTRFGAKDGDDSDRRQFVFHQVFWAQSCHSRQHGIHVHKQNFGALHRGSEPSVT